MKSLRHRLPSLISLMTFEAAARTLNFTRASEELHVSQAAVSKQVRALEDYLGIPLFERHGRRVELSHSGKYLYNKLSASLNFIADAVDDVRSVKASQSITLAGNNAVTHYWLGRVIEEFRAAHPEFGSSIRILSSDSTPDLFAEDVDMAVAYDPPELADWSHAVLFEEELRPVASQRYIDAHPLLSATAEHLLEHALLDYERMEPNWIDWSAWLRALGVDPARLKVASHANSYLSLVSAAEHSQGITLGTRYLLDEEITLGRLVWISPLSFRSGKQYCLMRNDRRPLSDDAAAMHAWLLRYAQLAT